MHKVVNNHKVSTSLKDIAMLVKHHTVQLGKVWQHIDCSENVSAHWELNIEKLLQSLQCAGKNSCRQKYTLLVAIAQTSLVYKKLIRTERTCRAAMYHDAY